MSIKSDDRKAMLKEVSTYLKTEFIKFIQEKAITNGGNVPSQADFAQWLEVSPTSLSNWMSAKRPLMQDNADMIASKLGPKIYGILGMPLRMPNDEIVPLLLPYWVKLSDDQKRGLVKLAKEWTEEGI